MAIFRGTGGSGDSTTDTTVNTVTQFSVQAQSSATAAAASATASASSATAAAASAIAAQNAVSSGISTLGLTGYVFDLAGIQTGDLIHWNGSNLAPLGQANVTDGGNF